LKTEQPELNVIRTAFEVNSSLTEKLFNDRNRETIQVMPIPEQFHDVYQKKFELHRKYQDCADIVENYILQHAKPTDHYFLPIDIPISLHELLEARYDDLWDLDSRIEVFENLKSHIERRFEGQEFIDKLSKICRKQVKYLVILNDEEARIVIEIHFVECS
jgi:hypothetical protein